MKALACALLACLLLIAPAGVSAKPSSKAGPPRGTATFSAAATSAKSPEAARRAHARTVSRRRAAARRAVEARRAAAQARARRLAQRLAQATAPVSQLVQDVVAPIVAPLLPTSPPALPSLGVTAKEFSLVLSRATVPAGSVRVQLVNGGEDPHDLRVAPLDGQGGGGTFAETGPGTKLTQTLGLPAGRYVLFCTLPYHRELGMEAPLTAAQ